MSTGLALKNITTNTYTPPPGYLEQKYYYYTESGSLIFGFSKLKASLRHLKYGLL